MSKNVGSTDSFARGMIMDRIREMEQERAVPAPSLPTFLHSQGSPENRDLVLKDQESFWITVNGVSVWIRPLGNGVRVELYKLGHASEAKLDACHARIDEVLR